jgi:hypothetical protein
MRRHSQPVDDTQKLKFKGIAKRLEEGLFKAAQTKVFLLIHLILIYVCIWTVVFVSTCQIFNGDIILFCFQ